MKKHVQKQTIFYYLIVLSLITSTFPSHTNTEKNEDTTNTSTISNEEPSIKKSVKKTAWNATKKSYLLSKKFVTYVGSYVQAAKQEAAETWQDAQDFGKEVKGEAQKITTKLQTQTDTLRKNAEQYSNTVAQEAQQAAQEAQKIQTRIANTIRAYVIDAQQEAHGAWAEGKSIAQEAFGHIVNFFVEVKKSLEEK